MKIRFNLEKGPNCNKWQITDIFETWFLDVGTMFVLEKCKLVNHRKTADSIFAGANKRVCAWIEFETMTQINSPHFEKVRYNPRENPFWTYKGENVDRGDFWKTLNCREKDLCVSIEENQENIVMCHIS